MAREKVKAQHRAPLMPKPFESSIAVKMATGKKKRRYRPGTIARREIRRLQKSTKHVVSSASMERVIREIVNHYSTNGDMRIEKGAIKALHEAAEAAVVAAMSDGWKVAMINGKHEGMLLRDFQTAVRLGHKHLTNKTL